MRSKVHILGGLVVAAAMLAAGVWIGAKAFRGGDSMLPGVLTQKTIDEKVTLSVLRSEAMTFLVTRRTTTQIVVEYSESDLFGEWKGVLWATVTWTWGADLSKLTEKDVRRTGEAVYVRLPEPEMLGLGIEPGSEHFFSKGTFIPKAMELFRTGQQQAVLQGQIKDHAVKFARDQKLCPSREEMVRQLNTAADALRRRRGWIFVSNKATGNRQQVDAVPGMPSGLGFEEGVS
jgi:hypothetical protein